MLARICLVLTLVACSDKKSNRAPDPKPTEPAKKPTEPAKPADAPELAFDIVEGDIRNYFYRRGPVAAHLLASSGTDPRIIVAFPAGNTGIAVWFAKTENTKLYVDGPLTGVERKDGMRGISATLVSSAPKLEVKDAMLASIRSIRDYAYNKTPPEPLAHETLAGPPIVLRRATIDGKHHVELVVEPQAGTTATITGGRFVLTATPGNAIRFRITALQDDEILTPLPIDSLLVAKPADGDRDLRALAFLSYREKLLAGSWRFLTYFGRDTLLSVRMLLPVLKPEVSEAALGAVLERLSPDGDVAHEEDIGEFASLRHKQEKSKTADLRAPIYDYKMVDDDFLLAPVLAAYLLDTEPGKARAKEFLARKTTGGITYAAALEKNIDLVIKRATPFATKPVATNLIAILPKLPVGNWRDSEEGLGRGRYAFDINVALVPAALDAAARLQQAGYVTNAANAQKLAQAWLAAEKFFTVTVPADVAKTRVTEYAASQGGFDAKDAVASLTGPITFHALSLDARGKPVPVMHTDDGFVLMFGNPSPEYLEQVAGRISRPFPAGLRTPVGVVVANAAFTTDAKLREIMHRSRYHGAVVWSWQQALLAAGIDRQLARTDLPAATKTALETAERDLWGVIDAMAEQRTGELWTWEVKEGRIGLVPFGQQGGHADESNAVQLWSTVYLGVRRPARVKP